MHHVLLLATDLNIHPRNTDGARTGNGGRGHRNKDIARARRGHSRDRRAFVRGTGPGIRSMWIARLPMQWARTLRQAARTKE